jgi:hypothetical protein
MDDPPPVHTLMIEVWTATPTILQSRRKRGGLMPHTLSFFSWDCRNMKWEWYQRLRNGPPGHTFLPSGAGEPVLIVALLPLHGFHQSLYYFSLMKP